MRISVHVNKKNKKYTEKQDGRVFGRGKQVIFSVIILKRQVSLREKSGNLLWWCDAS